MSRTIEEIREDIAYYEEKQQHTVKNQDFTPVLKICDNELRAALIDGIPTDELARLAQAWKEGRYVVLPTWGKVFIHSNGQVQEMEMVHYRGNTAGIYDMRCECADQFEDCESICNNEFEKACAYNFRVAEIGKTVFLTREEAEAALDKGEGK